MADAIRINGNQFSWASVRLKIAGEPFHGFTSINYADKRERVKAYGMGRHHAPRGRSHGKYTTEPVKLVGWKSSVQELRALLASQAADGKSYGDVEFPISLQYIEADETPMIISIERCVWTGNSTADEENPDPLKEEIEIDCMYIRRNELVLFDAMQQGAP
jgi:hypothetical protein